MLASLIGGYYEWVSGRLTQQCPVDPPHPSATHFAQECSLVSAPPDERFLRQALSAAMGTSPEAAPQQAISFYRFALQQTWIHMSRIVGPLGAKVIAEHGVRRVSRRCPEVRSIVVTDYGIDLSTFSPDAGSDVGQAMQCLEDVCVSVFQTLAELTGNVVLGPLLERLKDGPNPPA